ncbi:MAG: PhoU domain-containing protein, partial [Clostridia bacterium]|nr:PhoU domain-containing protein [Clostridia bacterium]
ELNVLESAVSEIVDITFKAFTQNDLNGAGRVEPLEEVIDGLCDEMKTHHIDRLQKGNCTLNQGFVFNDLITNFERIADHCSNIAVAIIELEDDEFDTHEYLESIKEVKDASFSKHLKEYQDRYSF